MKRIFSIALFGTAAALLGGCPVYPDSGSGYGYRLCDQTGLGAMMRDQREMLELLDVGRTA